MHARANCPYFGPPTTGTPPWLNISLYRLLQFPLKFNQRTKLYSLDIFEQIYWYNMKSSQFLLMKNCIYIYISNWCFHVFWKMCLFDDIEIVQTIERLERAKFHTTVHLLSLQCPLLNHLHTGEHTSNVKRICIEKQKFTILEVLCWCGGVLFPGDMWVSLSDIPSVSVERFFQTYFLVQPGTNCTYRWYLILLFLHLEEQTDSGKCKNVVHKYIKRISVLRSYIFLNRFVLRDEGIAKQTPCVESLFYVPRLKFYAI